MPSAACSAEQTGPTDATARRAAINTNHNEAEGMDALAFDLKTICDRNRDGSHATKANRHRMLQAMSRDLHQGGYRLPAARSLKPKHAEFLVDRWQAQGLDAGTIKNRMSALRWWAAKVNKASVIPRDNGALGIPDRQRGGESRAQKLDLAKVAKVTCPRMQFSLRLMAAFGLRMEEALKIRPALADQGDRLALKASWTKGGRFREIPVLNDRQRALLQEAKQLAGNGSLIPPDKSYIQHRKAFEHHTLKAGFANLHGLRHNYAQWRYKALTGRPCPKPSQLTPAERFDDREARRQIALELGHNRLDVTRVYLG